MPLPNYVIVGERKSGTTSLCHWMVHPDVYMHPREDMDYFIEDEILATTTNVAREDLTRDFVPHVRELESLLDRDFHEWELTVPPIADVDEALA